MKPPRRAIALLLLSLSFVVGALSGMALEEALGIDWFEFLDEDRGGGEKRLLAGLGLTDAQRERAEDILERQEDRLEDYWKNRLPEIRQMMEQSYAEIRADLDPDQQSKFDKRVRKLDGRVPDEVRDR
jgi:hypothetical protein